MHSMKKILTASLLHFCVLAFFLTVSPVLAEEESDVCSPKKEETKEESSKEKKKEDEDEGPPPIGNFSLPESQQPGPLFGFGGNIIEEGEIQVYFFADALTGRKLLTMDLIPGILFGVTDKLSLFFNAPFTPLFRNGDDRSSGLLDFFVQLEYAFYEKKNCDCTDQATILGNITLPTGSIHKNPPTGFGSTSFFLGTTFTRTWIDWVAFTAYGAMLTTSHRHERIGNQFLYQFGFARNLPSPPGWIYAWMLEFDGQYNQKNEEHGHYDPDTGGNTIYVTPSLWMSCHDFLLQFGVSLPIHQHLFGHQRKYDYVLNFNIAWSFY